MRDTGDGDLSSGESTAASLTQIYIRFSEPIYDPGGDSDPDDVTNPDNYILVADGGDAQVDTIDCASGFHPGDSLLPLEVRSYEPVPSTVRLAINNGVALPASSYRLLVCGSTSIVDQAGTALDGDNDGQSGDDGQLDFEVTATNLLRNPNFDDDLAFWALASALPTEIDHTMDDADGAPTSGSVQVVSLAGPNGAFTVSQCVQFAGSREFVVDARARIAGSSELLPTLSTRVESFPVPNCTGSSLEDLLSPELAGDTGGVWLPISRPGSLSGGTRSARVSFLIEGGSESVFALHIDNISFVVGPVDLVFQDGFESGGFSAWSDSTP